MTGWIKLHRRIVDSDIYMMPPLYLRVFERLILEANHQDKEIPFKYSGDDVATKKLIKRGERQTSIRQICEWVGWYERGVFKTPNAKTVKEILDWLEANGMIEIYPRESNRDGTHYKVVNYDTYQAEGGEKVTVQKQFRNSSETVTGSKQECIKNEKNDKKYKESSQPRKRERRIFPADSPEYRLALMLRNKVHDNLPSQRVPKATPESLAGWCVHIERMMRLDGYTPDDIALIIDWCQNDSFWRTNIRSASKLREKHETLVLQMERRGIYLASKQRDKRANDPYAIYDQWL